MPVVLPRGTGETPAEPHEEATTGESFGDLLRRLRAERGLSLADLSRSAHYSRGHLSKVENGQKTATADLARSCDAALDSGGALLRLISGGRAGRTACPYPGLASFGADRARWFFGREQATAALVELVAQRLCGGGPGGPVAVVGPSGAGKSSLLHAGLLPAIGSGALPVPGSGYWPVVSLVPTARPLDELAAALARATGSDASTVRDALAEDPDRYAATLPAADTLIRRGVSDPAAVSGLVLVADQFEEVFTLCGDDHERHAFVRALYVLGGGNGVPRGRVAVVLSLRADYYGRCLDHPELVTVLRDGQFPLGPMTRAELRAAIAAPARQAGLDIEPGLVEVLLGELGDHHGGTDDSGEGSLPLLAHALWTTWQQREENRLTLAGYRRTGGIRGAVATSAERVYLRLGDTERAIARRLLSSLVSIGEDNRDTRRRVARDRLLTALAEPEAAARVLAAFGDARLLTMDASGVEITHEALLYAWPRLRGWLDTDRVGLRNEQRLRAAAEEWEASGRDPALLYRGTQLAVAVDWRNGRPADEQTPERRFLDAAVQRENEEAAGQRRRTRRLRQLVAALSALVLATVGTTGFAFWQRAGALAERDRSAAQVAVDEADRLRQVDPSLAMGLSLAAYRVARTPRTRGALLASSGSVFSTPLPGHRYPVRQASTSRSTLVSVGDDGVIRLTELGRAARPGPARAGAYPGTPPSTDVGSSTAGPPSTAVPSGEGTTSALALDRSGRLLATGGRDAVATIRALPSPAAEGPVADLPPRRPVVIASIPAGSEVTALALSPDGRTAAVGTAGGGVLLARVDRPGRAVKLTGHLGAVNDAAFRPDGRVLATAGDDHTVRLWDTTRADRPALASTLRGHHAQVRGVEFAPDGRLLASVGFDRTLQLTRLDDPRRPGVSQRLTGHNGLIHAVAFRPDGRQLVTGADDQTARLWDPASGRQLATLPQPCPVRAVAFGPDGALITGDDEGRVRLWHLPPPVLLAHRAAVPAVAYLAGGRMLVTAGGDATARIWNLPAGGTATLLATLAHPAAVNAVAADPSGRLLITAGQDRLARLWDVSAPRRPRPLAELTGHTREIYAAAVSGDGRFAVTAGEDHTARLWDIADPHRPVALATLTDHTDRINSVALSGDGRLLATAGGDYRARVWDVSDRQHPVVVDSLLHPNQVNGVAISPDGRELATTGDDRKIRLWRLADRRGQVADRYVTEAEATLVGHREASRGVAFAVEGRTLATTSDDHTAQLWDISAPGRPALLSTLAGHTGPVLAVAFDPAGGTLVTADSEGMVRFWVNDVPAVIDRICALDGPGLSRPQWAEYFPDQPYRSSCGVR